MVTLNRALKVALIALATLVHAVWVFATIHVWLKPLDYPEDAPAQLLIALFGIAAGVLGGVLVYRRARGRSSDALTGVAWGSISATGTLLIASFPVSLVVLFPGASLTYFDFVMLVATGFNGIFIMPGFVRMIQAKDTKWPKIAEPGALIVVLLMGVMLTWMSSGWVRFETETYHARNRSSSLAELSQKMRLKFPQRAKLIGSRYEAFLEFTLVAKVEMSPADLGAFMRSLPAHQGESRKDRSVFAYSEGRFSRRSQAIIKPWWDPDSATKFLAMRMSDYSFVMISSDDPRRVVVYLYCHDS